MDKRRIGHEPQEHYFRIDLGADGICRGLFSSRSDRGQALGVSAIGPRVTIILTRHYCQRYRERVGRASPASQKKWLENSMNKNPLYRTTGNEYKCKLHGSPFYAILEREGSVWIAKTVKEATMRITKKQIKKIYAVARELGMDNDLLHALVYGIIGKEHISDMTKHQAGLVIEELERRANRSSGSTTLSDGRKVTLATKRQRWLINKLEKELGWEDNPRRLQGFVKKYIGVDNPRWMTKVQAGKIIEGMKALLSREAQEA